MKHLSRSILLLICLTVLFQVGYACTCVPVKVENEVKKTEYIFVGRVTKITEETSSTTEIANGTKKFFITFKVKQNLKGTTEKEITIIQYKYKEDMPCGSFIHFEKKKKYLVSANKTKNNEIKVDSFCLRTQRFDKNSDRYKELLKLNK